MLWLLPVIFGGYALMACFIAGIWSTWKPKDFEYLGPMLLFWPLLVVGLFGYLAYMGGVSIAKRLNL